MKKTFFAKAASIVLVLAMILAMSPAKLGISAEGLSVSSIAVGETSVDKGALNAEIALCQSINTSDCSIESANLFTIALVNALFIQSYYDSSEYDVEDALSKLQNARKALVFNIPITSVTVSPEKATCDEGETITLTAALSPNEAIEKGVIWSTSDDSTASVSNGVVTGKKAGTAIILATTINSNKTATCSVTVKALTVYVSGVILNQSSAALNTGNQLTLKETVLPTNAINKMVTWLSSNKSVATVADGVVKAIAPGTATITVTTQDGNKTDTCAITVKASVIPVSGVTLDKPKAALFSGSQMTLKETVLPANATNKAVTWMSSNTAVATVKNGVIKAMAPGTSTITVTTNDGKKTAKCIVNVQSYVSMRIDNTKAIRNGVKTTIDNAGTKPFKISGKTMLPLRFLGEKMGAKVTYVNDKSPIKMVYGDITVEFTLGSKTMTIYNNGKKTTKTLDVPAQKKNTKTYIPLRAIGEALGFDVYYDSGTEIIIVNSPKMTSSVRAERLNEAKGYIK